FTSLASNLVTGDTNNAFDVFVRDLVSGTTSRVAGFSSDPAISGDGRYVAFDSLDLGDVHDTNGVEDVYVDDRVAGVISRARTSLPMSPSRRARRSVLATSSSSSRALGRRRRPPRSASATRASP